MLIRRWGAGAGAQPGGGAGGGGGDAPQFPTLLAAYAKKPPFQAPGVDYFVGLPSATVLKNPTAASATGISVNSTDKTVTISGNDKVLDGYDFSVNNGWKVINTGTRNVIQNCKFVVGSNNQVPIDGDLGGILTVEHCTFDGGADAGRTINLAIDCGTGLQTIRYNRFTNLPDDAINFTNNCSAVVDYNLFDQLNVGAFHSDPIQTFHSPVTSLKVRYNTVYQPPTWNGDMNAFFRIGDEQGNEVKDVEIAFNVIVFPSGLGGTDNVFQLSAADGVAGSKLTNLSVHDNYIDETACIYAVLDASLLQDTTVNNPSTFDNWSMPNNKRLLWGPYNNKTANLPTNPPAAPSITGHTTSGSAVALTGTAVANAYVNVFVDGVLSVGVKANGSGAWSVSTPNLAAGAHTITARQNDDTFNSSADSTAVTHTI